jgi:hypothetical protein
MAASAEVEHSIFRVLMWTKYIGTVKLRIPWVGEVGAVGYLARMTTTRDPLYSDYRYPAELISYAVWLYFRLPLSLRMVDEMLAPRGISVTYG